MFWSGEDVGGKPGTAAWDLFRAEDTELVRLSPSSTTSFERLLLIS